MKYSHELCWKAVYEFVPDFKLVKGLALPEALNKAAVVGFLEIGNNGISSLGLDRGYAARVIQVAIAELWQDGHFTFGEQTEYWQ